MGFYEDHPPPHGHRTPSDLADEELLEALHGNACYPSHTVKNALATSRTDELPLTRTPKKYMSAVITHTDDSPAARPARVVTPRFRHLFRPGDSFRLLLAIEDDDNARCAICVADMLTVRGAIPTVISAAEIMLPAPRTSNSMVFYAEAALGGDFHCKRRRSLATVIAAATGRDQDWPITSVVGDASASILDAAEIQRSDLILMGVHHHGAFEQAIGENTATRVMAGATAPVLGVRSYLKGLPRRIMVAADFGDASREAAHLAANLADPGGTVILVHATIPSPIVEVGDEGAALVAREGIEHAFSHLADEISQGKTISVETVTRFGDAGKELIAAAKVIAPDLIAIASQRHRLITRLLLGSVTRKLTREGSWPMLVTPPLTRV